MSDAAPDQLRAVAARAGVPLFRVAALVDGKTVPVATTKRIRGAADALGVAALLPPPPPAPAPKPVPAPPKKK